MYYLLNERYRLCGWEKLPYAIIDRKYGRAQFVNKFILDTLEMCNGKIDFSIPIITDDQRKLVEQLVKEGVVSECEKGSELKEKQKYIFYNNRYMNTVHWSITGKCNCKCKHCYMSAPDAKYGDGNFIDIETLKKLKHLLEDIHAEDFSRYQELLAIYDYWLCIVCILWCINNVYRISSYFCWLYICLQA